MKNDQTECKMKATPDIDRAVYPGLWLDPAALLRGDLARVLTIVQQGLIAPEDADFVSRLARVKSDSQHDETECVAQEWLSFSLSHPSHCP